MSIGDGRINVKYWIQSINIFLCFSLYGKMFNDKPNVNDSYRHPTRTCCMTEITFCQNYKSVRELSTSLDFNVDMSVKDLL